ncbi:general substrate transporter [Dichotomopilus funicola]|uniref:General substrate transporter n=1 Tax=Dichotomopilus funicola TaxID=1934379 RepID=A0AAN6V500_9PEZI|nr:general substrate transporter [Dichotomopilus funicola]
MTLSFISPAASGYAYFCAFFAGVGSLLWGYDSGIFGTAQAQDYFNDQFHPDPALLGGIISVYTAGGAIGCLLSGPIGNRWGRRGTIQIGAVIAAIGTTLQTAAQESIMLIIGRLVTGLAIGVIYFAIPMFQSEISPASHRGLFVGLHAQFIGFGYMISNWVGFGISYTTGQVTFRFPVGLQIFWAVLLFTGTFLLPESPRWLIEKGRADEAEAVMKRLRRSHIDPDLVKKELIQMRDQIRWEKENEEISLLGILRKPSYRKRLLLGCGVQIGQQICGISAINYYQTLMYKSLGIQGHLVLALAGVWGLTGPLANIFCLMWIIDRVKRRTLFIAGSVAMTVDIAIVQAFVAVYGGSDNTVANGFGIAFLILFGVFFSLSWNSGAPVYTAEIFPTQIRAVGGAISTFWSFVIQVILAQASPTALENVGWRYYFFFIATNITCIVAVYFFLPETKGKSLEEISEVFGDVFVSIRMDEDLKQPEEEDRVPTARTVEMT